MTARFCVCVPAKNESDRLPVLLQALAAQNVTEAISVVVALNNCTDNSAGVLAAARTMYAGRLALHIDSHAFPPAEAHAGAARRRAMEIGAGLLPPDGVLLCTDADARPPPGWLVANLRAIGTGLDIAGGRLVIDPTEPLPPAVAVLQSRLERYWALVRAIEDAADPCAWDPPPRHGDHTGASLAMTVAAYHAAGGVPLLATGEDRALVRAVQSQGGRLGHPPDIWVHISPRRQGRASAGMAAAMERLHQLSAPPQVPALPHWRNRAEWRRTTRAAQGEAAMLAQEDALPPLPEDMQLTEDCLA